MTNKELIEALQGIKDAMQSTYPQTWVMVIERAISVVEEYTRLEDDRKRHEEGSNDG